MKKVHHVVVALLFPLMIFSCEREPINITCADPLGSDPESLYAYSFSCMQVDYYSCFRFESENKRPYIQSYYSDVPADAPLFIDIGEVDCLGNVNQKPGDGDGWAYAVWAELHHGYVVKTSDGKFGRIFIDSWEMNADTVTVVNITRQYSY